MTLREHISRIAMMLLIMASPVIFVALVEGWHPFPPSSKGTLITDGNLSTADIFVAREGPTDVFTLRDGNAYDDCGEFYVPMERPADWHPDAGHPALCAPKPATSNAFFIANNSYISVDLVRIEDNGKAILVIVDKGWHEKSQHPEHPSRGMVTLYGCGAMVFGDEYDPDEAAIEFWKALIRMWPHIVFGTAR